MNRDSQRYRFPLAMMAVALLLAGALYAGAGWYRGWSAAHLPPLAKQLGEVALERGGRCEAAGAQEAALAHYEEALAGHFHGEQNRNHCEKRCGVVLVGLGRYREALPHFERAQTGPHASLNGYRPWAESLIALERWDEAVAVVEKWREVAHGERGNAADARHVLGRIAMRKGEESEAEMHLRAALVLIEEHRCRSDLARVLAARGDFVAAREMMAAYLGTAPPDGDTVANWALLAAWVKGEG